jgi:hypothetical protein
MNFVLLVLIAVAIVGVFVWLNVKEPDQLDEFEARLREFLQRFKK